MLACHSLTYILNENLFFSNLSAQFQAAHLHLISGKNGVGKSTLLHLLHGDLAVESGVVTIDETRYALNSREALVELKKMVGFVPQSSALLLVPELTVGENLQLGALKKVSMLASLPEADVALIKSFNIESNKRADQLSGGQKHIVAIAMMLQQTRKVLLLDEPVAALDDENAALVISFLERLVKEGMTIVVVTHDPIEVTVPLKQWELIKQSDGTRNLLQR